MAYPPPPPPTAVLNSPSEPPEGPALTIQGKRRWGQVAAPRDAPQADETREHASAHCRNTG